MSEDNDETYKPDALDVTPMMVLKMEMDEINERAVKGLPVPSRIFILTIYDDDGEQRASSGVEWSYKNAGFTFSALIGILAIVQAWFVRELLPDRHE